jgi:predicted DNA-binding protein (UPF0251 family)
MWTIDRDPITVGGMSFSGIRLRALVSRFAAQVDSSGGPDACWPWLASLNCRGYGRFHAGGVAGRNLLAHRVAFELAIAPLRANACHRCDFRPCCNPRHLFDGTQLDNIRDAQSKGRIASGDLHGMRLHPESRARGEAHHAAKLTADDVIAARLSAASGETFTSIADRLGVSRTTISEIANGGKWQHIGGPRTRGKGRSRIVLSI